MDERANIEAKLDGRMLRDVLRERLTQLAFEVDRTRQERGFREALDAMRRFWRYSPFNEFVIGLQRPNARRVAARSVWEALGRKVNEGEPAIGVLAPTRGRRRLGFIAVPVYDVRQTRGRRPARLDLALGGRSQHVKTLERAAARLGIAVEYGGVQDGARAQSEGGLIRVRRTVTGRDRVAALAHELGHEVLHQAERLRAERARRTPKPRTHEERETEADATAYVVLGVLGLPSKAPTYIAWQGGDGAQVLRSLTRVQRAAKAILEAAGVAP
ncbi:MAG: hypothetical protein ACJ79E_02425 [Anaeromyxobacteraceae bacterium]